MGGKIDILLERVGRSCDFADAWGTYNVLF